MSTKFGLLRLLQNNRSFRKRSQGTQRNRHPLRSMRSFAAILQGALFFCVAAFCILNSSILSAQTPYYYTNRTFGPVGTQLGGVPTFPQLNSTAKQLTATVPGTILLDSNETYAILRQTAITICYGTAEGAWNGVLAYNGTPSNFPGKIYDNVGWIRGAKSTQGDWGAYLWVLQNRIAFQSSTSLWWRTSGGR